MQIVSIFYDGEKIRNISKYHLLKILHGFKVFSQMTVA